MTTTYQLLGDRTGNTFRAAIALHEAGIDFTPLRVNLRLAEQRSDEFMAINAAAQVPVLVANTNGDSLVLPQSNAIMFYAAGKGTGELLGTPHSDEHLRMLERFFYFLTDVVSPNNIAFAIRSRGDSDGDTVWLVQRAITRAMEAERFLRDSHYMAGNRFTLADIVGFTIIRSFSEQVDWSKVPRLREWYDRVAERPAVQRGLAVFSE